MYNKQSVDSNLANLNVYKYDATITDANDCYVNGKITRYILNGAVVANLPDTSNVWLLKTNASDKTFSSNHYGYQIAEMVGTKCKYSSRWTRKKYSPNDWGSWEKFTTETDLENCVERYRVGDLGSSSTQYLVFNLTSLASAIIIDLSITDSYGGQIHITGRPDNDTAFGGFYHSIKVKRLINGDFVTDTGTTNNKITRVYLSVTDAEKLLVVNFGTYGMVNIQNFSGNKIPYYRTNVAPTETRVITMQ